MLLVLATETAFLQSSLLTRELTGTQWLACIGLALVLPVVVEAGKWARRRRAPQPPPVVARKAVAPARALSAW